MYEVRLGLIYFQLLPAHPRQSLTRSLPIPMPSFSTVTRLAQLVLRAVLTDLVRVATVDTVSSSAEPRHAFTALPSPPALTFSLHSPL